MSANKTNFTGWSGSTFDITKLNFSGRTASVIQKSSPIVKGPVVISKDRPKKSTITPGVKQMPVAKGKSEIIFDATKASKLGRPSRLSSAPLESNNLPFTAGTVDTSFPYGANTGFDGDVFVSKVQSDGKILVGGDFFYYSYNGDSYYSPFLIRLNSDGSPDFDFAYTYHADYDGWEINGIVRTIEIQSDGKILIGGRFDAYSGGTYYYSSGIMRFNSDGTFDDTLFVGDGFNDDVFKIIIQPDGKILVAGSFYQYNNIDNWRIIRLNSNGTPDLSFNTGDGIDYSDGGLVWDMVLQPNGKIILGGDFYDYNGYTSNHIVRLNLDGSYDDTFVTGDGFNDVVYSLALQSDGKIIVGGEFYYYNNIDLYSGYIVRLGTNGEMDTRFGYGFDNTVISLSIQSDDKILVGGYFSSFYSYEFGTINIDKIVRFQSDCTFDLSFVFDSGSYNGKVYSISLDSNDKTYVGGSFYEDGTPWILNRFGRLNNFVSEYPYTYTVVACAQPLIDETITYVVGSMTPLDRHYTYSLQSIQNPSITVCGFLSDIYPSNIIDYTVGNVYDDCYQAYTSNYKQVLFEECLGDYQFPPVWYVDNKFEIGDIFYLDTVIDFMGRDFLKFSAKIIDIIPWSEGNPWGDVWYYAQPVNYVTYSSCDEAIEANGVIYVLDSPLDLEQTYALIHKKYSYEDYNSALVSLLNPTLDNPVKVLVHYVPIGVYEWISGGTPNIYSPVDFKGIVPYFDAAINGLTSMAPKGIVNDFFNNTGFDGSLVYTMVEQPDGKLLIGGNFDQYLDVNVGNFMRINPDGSLDETFYLGQFNSYVRAIALQSDGKILIGGDFTNYDGEYAGRIIRLNSDGTIDNNFTFNVEFDNTVRAIAVQRDGKIVVGGDFGHYGDYESKHLIRLNSNGTPDNTLVIGVGFSNGGIYTIKIETIRDTPFYSVNNSLPTYTENIIVGGEFDLYNSMTAKGIVKLSPTGDMLSTFGKGFNVNGGDRARVNRIIQQPDGKLIVIGGSNQGNDLVDYNGTCIPQNMVRLVGDGDGGYQIDTTFIPYPGGESGDCGPDYDAGFDKAVLSVALLPNGKYMVGGQFSEFEWNENREIVNVPYLVRLNSDGSLDETFTFTIDDNYVNDVLLLSSGRLLVGGRFSTPQDLLLELFIGEDYVLRSFETCDGLISNIFLSTDFPLITILDLVSTPQDPDDSNYVVTLPLPFDVNFLGTNYTEINVSTNSYITFGSGGNPTNCCFTIPDEINTNGPALPGVYISTTNGLSGCMDDYLFNLYSGLTDNGNTMVIRYEGTYLDYADNGETIDTAPPLVYNFKFYKDNSEYFDLIIESNTEFCESDPTGGTSDGTNSFINSFDSSSENSYRINSDGTIETLTYSPFINTKPIKANVNDRVAVCGIVGDVITTPQTNGGVGGSMYFNGMNDTMVQIDNSGQFGFGGAGEWDFTIEWFQYWEGGVGAARPFSIGTYPLTTILQVSLESSGLLWIGSADSPQPLNLTLSDLENKWVHFAITRYFDSANHLWSVYVDGVRVLSEVPYSIDLSNTYPLIIGNQINNDGKFQGYITNFRINNQTAIYSGPTITVPTSPLTCDSNIILTMDATNEAGVVTDSCNQQTILSSTGVIWSDKTPFVNTLDFSLFTATNFTNYNSCDDCGQLFNTILYVRTGVTEYVTNRTMTKTNVDNVLANGPIFTTGGVEAYEIINYYY